MSTDVLPGGRSARRPTSTTVRSCRSIGSSQRFHDRRMDPGLATSAVNDSPGIDSTTREPVPIRAYGCPEGSLPVSIRSVGGTSVPPEVPERRPDELVEILAHGADALPDVVG